MASFLQACQTKCCTCFSLSPHIPCLPHSPLLDLWFLKDSTPWCWLQKGMNSKNGPELLFCVLTPRRLVGRHQSFSRTLCLHLQGFLQNVGTYLWVYTASEPRIMSSSPPSEHQISHSDNIVKQTNTKLHNGSGFCVPFQDTELCISVPSIIHSFKPKKVLTKFW